MNANFILSLFCIILVMSGSYLLLGLCCNGNLLSRITGGLIGITGLAGLFLAIIPAC